MSNIEIQPVHLIRAETTEWGIFFTQEEYNQHIKEVIEEALQTAVNKVVVNDYDEHYQYNPHVDEDSIKNTFQETFDKFKL